MKEKMDSRLEGGPFDGAHGHVEDPPPAAIFLRPCPNRCGCGGDGYHYRLDARLGYECYRLLAIEDAVAVYRYDLVDLTPRETRAEFARRILGAKSERAAA